MRLAEILLAWLGYFALHSLLAAASVKGWVGRHWPRCLPGYRLAFNAIAVLTVLPVLWLVDGTESPWLWQWRGIWAWVANGVVLMAILGLLVSLHAYDMSEFVGLRQLRQRGADGHQAFVISPLHRFVRHPWYSILLVLIWTCDMNGARLMSGLAITLYLIVGSKLEERKLVTDFGDAYRNYMAAVPGLMPLPWKYLSVAQAAMLTNRQA